MWELDHKESWALKNWCFWTVVSEKTLESPLDSKEIEPVHPKGNQSWISLEGLMLKLKLQYFGYLTQRIDSLEKTLMLGKIEGRRKGDDRGWHGWMAWPTQWTWVWASSRSWWWTGRPGMLQSMGSQRVGHDWVTKLTEYWVGLPFPCPAKAWANRTWINNKTWIYSLLLYINHDHWILNRSPSIIWPFAKGPMYFVTKQE